ncbi:MAG: hypothetical protein GVY32_13065 [Gammaproteobacteria bacterium]|nr:hypothetical protein [Gammaproteobacteria bacterium]
MRLGISGPEGPLSWRDVLAGWRETPALAEAFGAALAELPFAAFRWETPAMTGHRLDTVFECVAVDDPSLDVAPDPSPFSEHLRDDRSVVRFPNLGGDAVMVVPCRRSREAAYSHVAAFCRHAPGDQQQALWREVAEAMIERLGDRPVWLNTAGAGVAWLHVRLDDRPKYYAHAPYRTVPREAL